MNILYSSVVHLCTSCQMCGAVCPKGAISFSLDKAGFYRPILDNQKCIDCGICTKVCYKYDNNLQKTTSKELDLCSLYAAFASDSNIVSSTTSGGVADVLAKSLVESGYRVFGVVYDSNSNRAVHKSTISVDETDMFRGSKYIQSYSFECLKDIVNCFKDEKIAYFGLPCQIYALSKYLSKIGRRDNAVLIDLFCHGCPSMLVWSKYSNQLKKTLKADTLSSVVWRSKKRGWGNYVLKAEANHKCVYSSPVKNDFFELFFCNYLLNDSCLDCQLRSTFAYADIRLGDFWGPIYKNNSSGVSGVTIITSRGNRVFKKIQSKLTFKVAQFVEFLPYQSWNKTYNLDLNFRKQLFEILEDDDKTLREVMILLNSQKTFDNKIKAYIKQMLYYLPSSIEFNIRKFFN